MLIVELYCVRVIGMPVEADWPDSISLPRSSFKISRQQSLEQLVPDIDPEALELMKVALYSN